MKVLFTSLYQAPNVYLKEIADSLRKYCEVICSVEAFWYTNILFDIIHIQWADELFQRDNINENDLSAIKLYFNFWKSKGTKIVATRHNEYPHIYTGESVKKLYDFVYSNADAVVHLGNYSKEKLGFNTTKNIVITHPNYNSLINKSLSKEAARKYLKLPKNPKILITLGAIRKDNEEKQIINSFKKIKSREKCILIISCSRIFSSRPSFRRNPIKRIMYILKYWYLRINKIIIETRFLTDNELTLYVTAADIIISPRIDSLNSGVIFLGYSFGKPVVGAGIGNMKNTLETTGNLPFIPQNIDSISKSMEYSLKHSVELGIANKQYSDKICSVEKIALDHFDLYESLLKKNQ
jgi:hypothetical protein